MKPSHPLLRSILTAALLYPGVSSFAATEVNVNSTNNQNIADAELTLPEAILIQNGTLGRALTPAEDEQVVAAIGEFIDVEAARQLHCTNRPDFAVRMAELYRQSKAAK